MNDQDSTPEALTEEIEADPLFCESNRATYCPEDNKLRLYVGRVPREEYLALKAEGWTSTPKQDCDFVAIWTPERRHRAERYAGIIEDEDAGPAERAADRAERFAGYRDKRTAEAVGSADRYDAQPQAYGFQSQARAERAARRHDGHARRALDAWSKAEYWQSRTAGVISHALYASTPAVRMGRIKEIEADIRRVEKSRAEYEDERNAWLKCQAMENAEAQNTHALRLAYFVSGDYIHPRTGKKSYLYDHGRAEEGRNADPLTGAELCTLYLSKHGPLAPEGPWLTHYRLRLAYENQMLEAQGGRAAFVEMEAGGFIGSHQITKVTKSPATGRVVSVEIEHMSGETNQYGNPWRDGKGARMIKTLINVERMKADVYTPPTDEQRAEYAAKVSAKKKAKAATAKAKAAAGENCPLINPTEEDAERLQALINERHVAEWERHHGKPTEHYKPKVAAVEYVTQAIYSANSKGTYAKAETRGLCADGQLEDRHSNMWTSGAQARAKARGPAVCKIRMAGYDPVRVLVITDKPQKPLPAAVWKPLAAPQPERPALVLVAE